MIEQLHQISEILPLYFTPVKGARIRVGYLHKQILTHLKLKASRKNLALIRAVVKASGSRAVVIQGKRYYAGLPKRWTPRINNPKKYAISTRLIR